MTIRLEPLAADGGRSARRGSDEPRRRFLRTSSRRSPSARAATRSSWPSSSRPRRTPGASKRCLTRSRQLIDGANRPASAAGPGDPPLCVSTRRHLQPRPAERLARSRPGPAGRVHLGAARRLRSATGRRAPEVQARARPRRRVRRALVSTPARAACAGRGDDRAAGAESRGGGGAALAPLLPCAALRGSLAVLASRRRSRAGDLRERRGCGLIRARSRSGTTARRRAPGGGCQGVGSPRRRASAAGRVRAGRACLSSIPAQPAGVRPRLAPGCSIDKPCPLELAQPLARRRGLPTPWQPPRGRASKRCVPLRERARGLRTASTFA